MGPAVLDEQSLPAVARYMQSDKCKQVFVMANQYFWQLLKTGAGISTSAGIPDFRSPETGLYANLARLNLPYPEAVFDISFFRRNPLPFYTLAHELAPGQFRPTLAHSFIRLLHEKSFLHTCFSQNIDTLERRAGIPGNKIVEAHGSFASQRCIDCKMPYDDDKIKKMIRTKQVPKCESCGGLVKPDIVFFGEALPPKFFRSIHDLPNADLLIILGTSLTVHPFASLTDLVMDDCPRVLINLDAVGDVGSRPNDVVVLGKCDEVVRQLSQLLHWEQELDSLWESTQDSLDPKEETSGAAATDLEQEVKRLTDEVDKTLKLSAELVGVTGEIDKKQVEMGEGSETRDPVAPGPEGGKASTDKDDEAKDKEVTIGPDTEARGSATREEAVPVGTETRAVKTEDSESTVNDNNQSPGKL